MASALQQVGFFCIISPIHGFNYVIIQGSRALSQDEVWCDHFIITQVRSGLKKIDLNFSKYKYLHTKIDSLGTVKFCVTIDPFL